MPQDDNALRDSLKKLRSELEPLNPTNRGEVDGWTAKATPFIRKNFASDIEDFIKACRPGFAPPVSGSNGSGFNAQQKHQQQLNQEAKERTLGFIDGLIAISENPTITFSALDTVFQICVGFRRFARQ